MAVLISIQPKWCELIASGKKTVEVRKTMPKIETPFKCYIYETQGKTETPWIDEEGHLIFKGRGQVIGEFVCKKIDRIAHCGTCNNDIRLRIVDEEIGYKELDYEYCVKCKLHYPEIDEYSNGRDVYGWHISDLVIYDEPKELGEFSSGSSRLEFSNSEDGFPLRYSGMTRPPQSWCYVEEVRYDRK